MKFYSYKIRLTSPLSVSDIAQPLPRSDTLFSAVCALYEIVTGNEVGDILGGRHAIFSSVFPRLGNVLFFPAPVSMRDEIAYVSESVLAGGTREDDAGLTPGAGMTMLLSKDEFREEHLDARITVEPVTGGLEGRFGGGMRNFVSYDLFAAGIDFHFLAGFKDDDVRKKVEVVLEALGETGIGGRGKLGRGRFEIESASEYALEKSDGPKLLLSLLIPTENEFLSLIDDVNRIRIERRLSYVTQQGAGAYPARPVRAIMEGSVIHGAGIEGAMKEVLAPSESTHYLEHRVYRSGYAVFLSLHAKEFTK
ncbi:MAG: hypothetical protein NUW37_11030 [Planctomycetes bacterium]|nr:hypothetical protein [Planctomycetota bacterium]